MRRLAAALALLVLIAAAPAGAAADPAARDAGLRGAEAPAAASDPSTPSAEAQASAVLAAPVVRRTDGGAAPTCRTGCAARRYACLSTDDGGCDGAWSACVLGCDAP